jgi:hypothetical protein
MRCHVALSALAAVGASNVPSRPYDSPSSITDHRPNSVGAADLRGQSLKRYPHGQPFRNPTSRLDYLAPFTPPAEAGHGRH